MMRVKSDERAEEPNKGSAGKRSADEASRAKIFDRLHSQVDQIAYEFANHTTVVLRRNGMFHKAIGSSALILRELGAKTQIRSYYSEVYKQEVLEMSIHAASFAKLVTFLTEKCGSVIRYDEQFFIIRLKEPMSTKRLKQLRTSTEIISEINEDILTKRRKDTPLAKEARELFKEAKYLVRDMPGIDGQVLAKMILETIMRLQGDIRCFMRNEKSTELWQKVDDTVDDLQGLLLFVPESVNQADRLVRMGRSLNKIITRNV
jgi:hypothetical protein